MFALLYSTLLLSTYLPAHQLWFVLISKQGNFLVTVLGILVCFPSMCFSLRVYLCSYIWSQLIIEGVRSGTQVGGKAGTIQERFDKCASHDALCLLLSVQGHLPRGSLSHRGLDPSTARTDEVRAPQTCLQSSSMEGFSHVRPLFSDDLSLCQVDKKEPNTHKHLGTDARSVSWREDDSLLLLLLSWVRQFISLELGAFTC